LNLDTCVKVKRYRGRMRIGELAHRAGVTPRQVRFYEARGLIVSDRLHNNYRDFSESTLARVEQIRDLLAAGLSTQVILAIVPCLQSPRQAVVFDGVEPQTVELLEHERDRLTQRITVLTRNRDAVTDYLDELKNRAHLPAAPATAEAPRHVLA
jgi:DNA-binding transcriptional MerR regulator